MKKLSLFVIILVALSQLIIATPAAAGTTELVGTRLSLYAAEIEFPENSPFHIRHGWIQPSTDNAIGIFDFALDVDGIFQPDADKWFSVISGDPDYLSRIWVFNFPAGMTGTHTFTGHWYAPCQYAVDSLWYPGPCPQPNMKVETAVRTLTVTFIP